MIGYLYGLNTLGAAAGAFTTTWLFLRTLGFEDILRIGAGLNAASVIGAALIWWRMRARPVEAAAPEDSVESSTSEPARFPMSVWLLIYALSGFVALSLEIVWFRILGVVQKSTSFTFGNLLGIYLVGLAAGVMLGVPMARRSRYPARTFLAMQAAVTLYAGAALTFVIRHVDTAPIFKPIWGYLRGYDPLSPSDLLAALRSGVALPAQTIENLHLFGDIYFALPALLIAPATLLMGASFPLLQRAVQVSPALIGRRVGWLQAFNIAGSMLGAMLVGWGSLHWLGTAPTTRAVVAAGGLFAVLLAFHSTRWSLGRIVAVSAAVVMVAFVVRAIPPQQILWSKMHGAHPKQILFAENGSGLSLLKVARRNDPTARTVVYTNGIGQSWLPYGSVHTAIGVFGAMLHPNPERVAVIGLGSGDTAFALGGSPKTRELICIEIVRPEYTTLTAFLQENRYPALETLLGDPRIRWRFTDGRTYIQRASEKFDVIEADALRPNSAYSGNLYSHEYFEMLKAHLKPGGLAVSWAPTGRVLDTFLDVFPYAIVVNDIAVGSEQPIDPDRETILRRLADPFTTNYYAKIGTEVQPLLTDLLAGRFLRHQPGSTVNRRRDLNSDLFPRDEFGVPSP